MITKNYDAVMKPVATAVAMLFAGAAYSADEALTLPELQIQSAKENPYKVERSANQKFTASLKDTPKTVTVITEDVIKDSGSLTLQDALRTTPGITFGVGEGGSGGAMSDRPFIRGYDAQASIFVDGFRDLATQNREIFAIERVEVIKGPGGAFDGQGSAGGSINIITKKAKADNFTSGSVGIGTDDYRRVTFDGNYMLGEDAAIRLVGMTHDADTPGRDGVDVKRWGFMPSLTLGLNGPTTATVSWYHMESDDTPDRGFPFLNGKPIHVSKDNFFGYTNRDYQETNTDIGTLELKHTFDNDVTLRNTSRYGTSDNEYVMTSPGGAAANFPFLTRTNHARKVKTTSVANTTDVSFGFNTAEIKHTMNVGVTISRDVTYQYRNVAVPGLNPNVDAHNPDNTAPAGVATVSFPDHDANNRSTSFNRSIYAFDTIEFNDQWLLNAGVRYDKFEARRHVNIVAGDESIGESDNGSFNYQLGLVYKVQPNGSIYATYATSTVPMGISNGAVGPDNGSDIAVATQDLDPERVKSFEVGTKWDVLDGLALNAAIFHIKRTDSRVTNVDTGLLDNIGETKVQGLELGAAGRLADKWSVFAGYTYLDSEQVKTATNAAGLVGKGKPLPTVARNSASLWTTYELLPQLTVGGGAFYTGEMYVNTANTLKVPSYVRLDAMATYKFDERINLQLNVQNLTDKRYFSNSGSSHGGLATVAAGRFAFLSLNFKF
ncbi:TonB-dependent siderophore receptor [Methylobacillus caricis]|uniref:TonB-dependent receptor n=1 Tax=Methylobacillus caricis TaxID=1971611 RepID=UPI001CFFEEA3|nr:TonB-dependent siderophore receptor [Methylobacillus caricis]MCB5188635.1 TonB-dependent siderophore receptor [Methylobacillus caricis]